jgi:hypothetical protein
MTFLSELTRRMFPNAEVSTHLANDGNYYVVRTVFRQEDLTHWSPRQVARETERRLTPQIKDRKRHVSKYWARRVR